MVYDKEFQENYEKIALNGESNKKTDRISSRMDKEVISTSIHYSSCMFLLVVYCLPQRLLNEKTFTVYDRLKLRR